MINLHEDVSEVVKKRDEVREVGYAEEMYKTNMLNVLSRYPIGSNLNDGMAYNIKRDLDHVVSILCKEGIFVPYAQIKVDLPGSNYGPLTIYLPKNEDKK